MPYASKAQRGYLHAHPEITDKKGHPVAAKWDAEIRAKKKGRVKKSKSGWAKPLAIGAGGSVVGGAVANQIPTVKINAKKRRVKLEKSPDDPRAKLKFEKRGKISKLLVPTNNDPFFNQEAAQKTFDLIMKMDDDTAEVFCHVVASDLLEQEVENNLVTLQNHLDEVIEKRVQNLKRATVRSISKGVKPDSKELSIMESLVSKVSNVNDDNIPNWEFERKIKRDQSTGRFQVKVSNRPMGKRPLPDETAVALGIDGTETQQYQHLSSKEKARYQSQYLQVANFLDAVSAATGGTANSEVLVHYKNDQTGKSWADRHIEGRPPHNTLLEPNTRVVGIEALPTTLTAGGTAFSLAGAMGNTMDAGTVGRINTAAAQTGDWSQSWLGAGEDKHANSNARLYARTKTLGSVAGTIGPPGSKVQLAGAMADIVGQYGPQAEEVLGPAARKTAYRYRGTERVPDKRLIEMYGSAIKENKKLGPIDPWEAQAEARLRTARGAGKQPYGSPTGVRTGSREGSRPKEAPAPSLLQMVAEREERDSRAPSWREREMGRVAVTRYLTDQLPSKKTYKLQLASGNTPPSEGVIINSNGQIVTQAVGYGDDHYLPFNLKNLKGLKGGEYIRNRSVGGLTSEDVYTGLISGARRVTVVSRSGTFTMEFKPDFRGGRRHNDKARRMTRRYEQILDAVQSERVERADVPPRWKKIIEQEVKGEYGPTASPRLLRAEIDARITEFKKSPKIEGRDLDRAEAEISRFEERQKRGEVSSQDVADYRKEVLNELRDLKEIHYRLNGIGYKAALDSLREQFPYYIDAGSIPKEEHLEEYEQDLGYVEPARNRPTAASAGWYGTAGKEHSGKFSAAYADYQRGLPGTPAPKLPPKASTATAAGATDTVAGASPGDGNGTVVRSEREQVADRAAEAVQQLQDRDRVVSAAVELQQAIKSQRIATPPHEATPEWWNHDQAAMEQYVDNDENLRKFDEWVQRRSNQLDNSDVSDSWQKYRHAKNRSGGMPAYTPDKVNHWQQTPYKFPNDTREAYRPSPLPGAVAGEINRIDGYDASLKFGQPLSMLTERQLQEEFRLSKNVREAMRRSNLEGPAAEANLASQFPTQSAFTSRFFTSDATAAEHLETIHRMRHLQAKSGWSTAIGTGPATGPPTAGGGGAGFGPPPSPSPAPAPAPGPAPAPPAAAPAPAAPQAAPPRGRLEPRDLPEWEGTETGVHLGNGIYAKDWSDAAKEALPWATSNKGLYPHAHEHFVTLMHDLYKVRDNESDFKDRLDEFFDLAPEEYAELNHRTIAMEHMRRPVPGS